MRSKINLLLLASLALLPAASSAALPSQAARHNRTVIPADWFVTTDYEYRGALGSVSTQTTSIDAPSSGNPSFSQSYARDGLGNLVSLAYPGLEPLLAGVGDAQRRRAGAGAVAADAIGHFVLTAAATAYLLFEVASSAADAHEVYQVWTTDTSMGERLLTTGLATAGLVAPGGGYSKADDALKLGAKAARSGDGVIKRAWNWVTGWFKKSDDVPGGGGRAKNKLAPDPDAAGPHTSFKRGPDGEISGYETYKMSDPRNPKPFTTEKRVDVTGKAHHNKVTGNDVPAPHAHGKNIPGGVRPAEPWEIPRQ